MHFLLFFQIELLQLRLQQERSMRLMLERAMGRVSSTLSPGHRHFATQVNDAEQFGALMGIFVLYPFRLSLHHKTGS